VNNFILKARVITLGLAVAFLPFSVRFCHLALILFLIACIAEGNFAEKGRIIMQNPLAWLLPAFFFLHLVGVFYSNNVSNAWGNLDKKIAFVLMPLAIVTTSAFTKQQITRLMWTFVAACVIGTIICLVNAIVTSKTNVPLWNFGPSEPYVALHPDASGKWHYFSYLGLASGIGIHPTYLAFYLLVCVLIVLRTITNRWLTIGLLAYLLIFIVLLSSRVVVIATALTLCIVAFRRKLLIAGIAAMIVVMMINPLALYRNAQEYTRSNFAWPPAAMSDNPISIRMSLMWLSIHAIRETNPIIGTGIGDVDDTIAASADRYNVQNVLETSDPHNQYLHTYIALGGIGLLMLLTVFIAPLWILLKRREFLVCAGLLAFMVVCATESALELQKGIVLFALAVSLTGNQLREWKINTSLTDRTDRSDQRLRSVGPVRNNF
jgi:hypothetical protein